MPHLCRRSGSAPFRTLMCSFMARVCLHSFCSAAIPYIKGCPHGVTLAVVRLAGSPRAPNWLHGILNTPIVSQHRKQWDITIDKPITSQSCLQVVVPSDLGISILDHQHIGQRLGSITNRHRGFSELKPQLVAMHHRELLACVDVERIPSLSLVAALRFPWHDAPPHRRASRAGERQPPVPLASG